MSRPRDVIVNRAPPARPLGFSPAATAALFAIGLVLGAIIGGLVSRGSERSYLEEQCLTPAALMMPIEVSARDPPTKAYLLIYRNQTSGTNEATVAQFDDLNTTAVNEALAPLLAEVEFLFAAGIITARQRECAVAFLAVAP